MDFEHRVKAYKFVAYSAVAFSVVAVFSVCVTLPMVYNYVNHVKKTINTDVKYCKDSARGIWTGVNELKEMPAGNRTARSAIDYDSLDLKLGFCDGLKSKLCLAFARLQTTNYSNLVAKPTVVLWSSRYLMKTSIRLQATTYNGHYLESIA
ncbi:unnamed protein product, partial [Mesorhabditis spiculigera]